MQSGTYTVKGLGQEHNNVPAEAQTQSAYSGVKHTNHEVMANFSKGRCFNNAIDANKF